MIWRLLHREAANKVVEALVLLQISTLLHLHLMKCSLREENQLGIFTCICANVHRTSEIHVL